MLLKLPVCILIVATIFSACQTNTTNQTTKDSLSTTDTSTSNTITSSPMLDPDPTDSIPADGYNAAGSNVQVADMIKKSLVENILKNDLSLIPDEERKFKYAAVDLNSDNTNEYFVALSGIYFCGSGGCTALLLDNTGKLITRSTVMDWPVYVDSTTTNGWHDVLMSSGGKLHVLKMKDGKYPSNPSIESVLKGDLPADAKVVLDVDKDAYPSFKF